MSGTRRLAIGICLDCGGISGGQWLRCLPCRAKFMALNQGFGVEEVNPFKGPRLCNLCKKTFQSHDTRSNHTCRRCRMKQLQPINDWTWGD